MIRSCVVPVGLIVCLLPSSGCKTDFLVGVLDGSVNNAQCPINAPSQGQPCSLEALNCFYPTNCDVYVTCSSGAWVEEAHDCGMPPNASGCTSHGGQCAPAIQCPGTSQYSQYSCGGNTVCCPPSTVLDAGTQCTTDCDCDPVHSIGCEGGHCGAVARLLYCCNIPNPPGWVTCVADGGTSGGYCVVQMVQGNFVETGACASTSPTCSSWQSSACVNGRAASGVAQSVCAWTDKTTCN